MNHYYESIQGWFNFAEVYSAMVAAAPKDRTSHFVELGAWKGKSTAYLGVEIVNSKKPIILHTVDHFLGSDEEAHKSDPELGQLYEVFMHNLEPVIREMHQRFVVHRMSTLDASRLFEDESVDFVWVDASHKYEDVVKDISVWFRKLRRGGHIGGDDYAFPQVRAAVKEMFLPYMTIVAGSYPFWLVKKTREAMVWIR